MKKNIQLIALDMDGTLFNSRSEISEENQLAIQEAMEAGKEVIISTGRPFIGLPHDFMKKVDMHYALTTNGAAVYDYRSGECIYSNYMELAKIVELLPKVLAYECHFDVFIDGKGYSQKSLVPIIERLFVHKNMKVYIKETRTAVDDIVTFIQETGKDIQKITFNFPEGVNGTDAREQVYRILSKDPYFNVVSGGFGNLEITKNDVSKASAFEKLADYLKIPMEETMAVGDSENDLDIIQVAGLGVAMANASEPVKRAADVVTLSNDEDGVAEIIREILAQFDFSENYKKRKKKGDCIVAATLLFYSSILAMISIKNLILLLRLS